MPGFPRIFTRRRERVGAVANILADRSGTMSKVLPERAETENLIIRTACMEDKEELQAICDTWENKVLVEGEEFPPDYIAKCLTEGDLPPSPNAEMANYRMKSIVLKETGKIIGFFDFYFGYPSEDTLWTSIFLVHKAYRKSGYGQEVIRYISTEARYAGFSKLGVGVYLKNWAALRFWTKSGYDQVFGVFGDHIYSASTFALIGLEKKL